MNVVSVMAHQDDELLCLGTMLKMQERGDKLHFVCVTDGCSGMIHKPDMSREEAAAIRDREMRSVADAVGATYTCLGEKDEYLYDTPEVRDRLIGVLRECEADVIFTHANPDYNIDHITVSELVRQCAMQAAYPIVKSTRPPLKTKPAVFLTEPVSGFEFQPTHYVDISEYAEKKAELAMLHKSQNEAFMAAFGHGFDEWLLQPSRHRGSQTGVKYAEGFRPMFVTGLIKPYSILP